MNDKRGLINIEGIWILELKRIPQDWKYKPSGQINIQI